MTHTKDKLANALREIGLTDMATKAVDGYYHDFLSPLPLPTMQLVSDLMAAMTNPANRDREAAIAALRLRVIDGEFDATTEESEEWAASPDGQAAMRGLING